MSSSDVKDKGDLLAGRKSIEREMERFKLCEKEMKTKAFSKEGLGAAAKLDPREQARAEIRDWLNATVDTLNQQVLLAPQKLHMQLRRMFRRTLSDSRGARCGA